MTVNTKAYKILNILKQDFLDKSVVEFGDPFRVLVSTIISQRTKDETTAKVSKKLFAIYGNVKKLADADRDKVEKIVKPSGLAGSKSKNLINTSKIIVEKYRGIVPSSMTELIQLPGVGRKTASCVINYAFKKPAIAVDVHVHRIFNRIGIIKTKTPESTESALKQIYKEKDWIYINRIFVRFGKEVCFSRSPNCARCKLNSMCKFANQK